MIKLLATLALGIAALPLLTGAASANGCHRDIRQDDRGWHRHGPDCERIQTHRDGGEVEGVPRERQREYGEDRERREYRERREWRERHRHDDDDDRPRCVERCQYVGPIKTCDRVCR